jgi:hypothetical protein
MSAFLFRLKSRQFLVSFIVFVVLAVYFHKDPLSIVNQSLFDRYSEGYVVCTIVRDVTDPHTGNTPLGLGVYPDKPACYSQFTDSSYGEFSPKDAYPYTDANWNEGVARAFPGFMVGRSVVNFIKYTPGGKIRFPNGIVEAIQDVDVNPLFMNVRLDGPIITHEFFDRKDSPPLQRIVAEYHGYGSQIGVPGFLFSSLYKVFRVDDLNFYRGFNTTMLAAVLAIIIGFAFSEFGMFPAGVLTVGTMVSPWLLGFAGNMYWMPWTWYAPLALVCLLIGVRRGALSSRISVLGCALYAIAIAIKASCGYEYMSTVMIASVVPVVYAATKNKAPMKETLLTFLKLGISGIAGFIAILLVHAKLLGGTIANGMVGIHEDMARRTYASGSADAALGNGAPIIQVLEKYFGDLLQPMIVGFDVPFYKILLFFCVVAAVLFVSKNSRNRALAVSFYFSILAPLSWFVLAKGHSFVHYFLNPVLWDLPTVLIGFLCVGTVLSAGIRRFGRCDIWKNAVS